MKALSIMQPWAWLIVNGHKDIENRDWQPANPGLKFRGKFLVHTGKKVDCPKRDYHTFWRRIWQERGIKMPQYEELELGGVVGMSEITDVVRESTSPWFFGPIGLVLGRAKQLPFIPYKGQLGFFDIDITTQLIRLYKDEQLTEGQVANFTGLDRIEIRTRADEMEVSNG